MIAFSPKSDYNKKDIASQKTNLLPFQTAAILKKKG